MILPRTFPFLPYLLWLRLRPQERIARIYHLGKSANHFGANRCSNWRNVPAEGRDNGQGATSSLLPQL